MSSSWPWLIAYQSIHESATSTPSNPTRRTRWNSGSRSSAGGEYPKSAWGWFQLERIVVASAIFMAADHNAVDWSRRAAYLCGGMRQVDVPTPESSSPFEDGSAVRVFRALGDCTRYKIVRLLVERGE